MFDRPFTRRRRIRRIPTSTNRQAARALATGDAQIHGAAAAALPLALVLVFLASCAGPSSRQRESAAYRPPTAVSGAVTFAQPVLAAEIEAGYLARERTPAALLRRAWLELLLRRPTEALDTAAEVLYAPDKPSANDESFARFLRAEAYHQLGQDERGAWDLGRARELALDTELRRRMAPQPTSRPASSWGQMAIEPRSSWQSRTPNARNLDPMQRPSRVTIHHSAMYFRDTRPQACAAQIARIQREHMQNRDYGDIGYHFLIDPSGRIWEGRELRYQGAHASGDNNVGNIGICLLGNFVRKREGQGPTAPQVRAMEQLVVQLMNQYGFGPDALYCHNDFKPTECPGPLMTPIVKQLAQQLRVRQQQAGGPFVAAAAEE